MPGAFAHMIAADQATSAPEQRGLKFPANALNRYNSAAIRHGGPGVSASTTWFARGSAWRTPSTAPARTRRQSEREPLSAIRRSRRGTNAEVVAPVDGIADETPPAEQEPEHRERRCPNYVFYADQLQDLWVLRHLLLHE